MSGAFDDISLPMSDAGKPAELSPDGDPGVGDISTTQPIVDATAAAAQTETPATTTPTTTPPAVDPAKPEETTTTPKDETKPDETTSPAKDPAKPEDEGRDKDGNLPFHKHPDWIAKQKEVEDLKTKMADMEKKLNEPKPADPQIPAAPTVDLSKTPQQRAADVIREKFNKGEIKPADQVELQTMLFDEIEHQKELNQQEETKLIEAGRKVLTDNLITLDVKDPQDQETVKKQLQEWHKAGVNVTPETIKIAVTNLTFEGKIKKAATPGAPTPTPESIAAEKKTAQERNDANGKISRPSNAGGQPAKTDKVFIKGASKMDLDEILAASVKAYNLGEGANG